MKLYTHNGYVNIAGILEQGFPFNFVTGGRGTGKTYTALKYAVENDIKFMLMRRTQSQCDIINMPQFNVFNALNADTGTSIQPHKISKQNAAYYHTEFTDGKYIAKGAPIGYTCALSTISNMRGFDASDIDLLIYDEFCPERHERPIKHEADAFFNAVETINRNRELKGKPPVKCLCLANSNDLANPLYTGLGVLSTIDKMRQKGREEYRNKDRGLYIISLLHSPISKQKEKTALYKLTADTSFADMALKNAYVDDIPSCIKSLPLAECTPIVTVGEITVYRHKGTRRLYISTHKAGTVPTFGTDETSIKRFVRAWGWIWTEYLNNKVTFEEYACEILLTKYLN